MKVKYLLIFAAIPLAACIEPSDEYLQRQKMQSMTIQTDDRFEVKRTAVIFDSIAYRNQRGIYLIRDKKTGKEYVGLSGVGVSEIGTSGKPRSQFEE